MNNKNRFMNSFCLWFFCMKKFKIECSFYHRYVYFLLQLGFSDEEKAKYKDFRKACIADSGVNAGNVFKFKLKLKKYFITTL